MAIYLTPEQVLDELGDKVVHGFSSVVLGAAQDLAAYRKALPSAVARASSRGLANWIHDAMRARALAEFDGNRQVSFADDDQYFDIYVRTPEHKVFRVRLKRHSATGRIANYPTQSAVDFATQPDDLLSIVGMRWVHLCVGYEWDAVTRSMGTPVMSLRDGSFDDVVWMVDLPAPPASRAGTVDFPVTPIVPTAEGPALPTIEVADSDEASDPEGSETQ